MAPAGGGNREVLRGTIIDGAQHCESAAIPPGSKLRAERAWQRA